LAKITNLFYDRSGILIPEYSFEGERRKHQWKEIWFYGDKPLKFFTFHEPRKLEHQAYRVFALSGGTLTTRIYKEQE
jgi:hypothetical protein